MTDIVIPAGTAISNLPEKASLVKYEMADGKAVITDIVLGKGQTKITIPETIYGSKTELAEGLKQDIADIPHVHAGGSATCVKRAVCVFCGQEYGGFAAHRFAVGRCSVCGMADPDREEAAPEKEGGKNEGGNGGKKADFRVTEENFGTLEASNGTDNGEQTALPGKDVGKSTDDASKKEVTDEQADGSLTVSGHHDGSGRVSRSDGNAADMAAYLAGDEGSGASEAVNGGRTDGTMTSDGEDGGGRGTDEGREGSEENGEERDNGGQPEGTFKPVNKAPEKFVVLAGVVVVSAGMVFLLCLWRRKKG